MAHTSVGVTSQDISSFLSGQRLAVAGVSRQPNGTANFIFRKLRDTGHEVYPVNPRTELVEGVRCYPDLASVPAPLHGVIAVTPAAEALGLVRQCAASGVSRIWFHHTFGSGSGSPEAIREAGARGVSCIAAGCPMMYCEPVDGFHRCARWWLRLMGRLPK